MKGLIQFIFPTFKAVMTVIGFLIGMGWTAYLSVYAIVRAEGHDIRAEVREIRGNDMENINSRFDRAEAKLDKIIIMIKDK